MQLSDNFYSRVKLLGLRVILSSGMVGKVTAIDCYTNIEISNELEGNKYQYWAGEEEIVFVYLPI